jgi:hypothetical protein
MTEQLVQNSRDKAVGTGQADVQDRKPWTGTAGKGQAHFVKGTELYIFHFLSEW